VARVLVELVFPPDFPRLSRRQEAQCGGYEKAPPCGASAKRSDGLEPSSPPYHADPVATGRNAGRRGTRPPRGLLSLPGRSARRRRLLCHRASSRGLRAITSRTRAVSGWGPKSVRIQVAPASRHGSSSRPGSRSTTSSNGFGSSPRRPLISSASSASAPGPGSSIGKIPSQRAARRSVSGDRAQRHPGVGDRTHGRPVEDVIPEEEAVPAVLLGLHEALGLESTNNSTASRAGRRRHRKTASRLA
jgi:hypothetical protein